MRAPFQAGNVIIWRNNRAAGEGVVVAVHGNGRHFEVLFEHEGLKRLAYEPALFEQRKLAIGSRATLRDSGELVVIEQVFNDGGMLEYAVMTAAGSQRVTDMALSAWIAPDPLVRLRDGQFESLLDFLFRVLGKKYLLTMGCDGFQANACARTQVPDEHLRALARIANRMPLRLLLCLPCGDIARELTMLCALELLLRQRSKRALLITEKAMLPYWIGRLRSDFNIAALPVDEHSLSQVDMGQAEQAGRRGNILFAAAVDDLARIIQQAGESFLSGWDLLIADELPVLEAAAVCQHEIDPPAAAALGQLAERALNVLVLCPSWRTLSDEQRGAILRTVPGMGLYGPAAPADVAQATAPATEYTTVNIPLSAADAEFGEHIAARISDGLTRRRLQPETAAALLQAWDSSPAAFCAIVQTWLANLSKGARKSKKGKPDDGSEPMSSVWSNILIRAGSETVVTETEFWLQASAQCQHQLRGKLTELRAQIERHLSETPTGKCLVFTRFRETQEWLAEQLRTAWPVSIFHGALDDRKKDGALASFQRRDGSPVMIAVDNAMSGYIVNCTLVIHYDLPWTPMVLSRRWLPFACSAAAPAHLILCYDHPRWRQASAVLLACHLFDRQFPGRWLFCHESERALPSTILHQILELPDGQQLEQELLTLADRRCTGKETAAASLPDAVELAPPPSAPRVFPLFLAEYEILENLVFTFLSRRYQVQIKRKRTGVYFLSLSPEFQSEFPQFHRQDYLLTFNRETALEDRRLEFFCPGHQLVDAVLSKCLLDDTSVTAAARCPKEAEFADFRGYQFCYLAKINGVEPREYVFDLILDHEGRLRQDLMPLLEESAMRFNYHEDARRKGRSEPPLPGEIDLCAQSAESEANRLMGELDVSARQMLTAWAADRLETLGALTAGPPWQQAELEGAQRAFAARIELALFAAARIHIVA